MLIGSQAEFEEKNKETSSYHLILYYKTIQNSQKYWGPVCLHTTASAQPSFLIKPMRATTFQFAFSMVNKNEFHMP